MTYWYVVERDREGTEWITNVKPFLRKQWNGDRMTWEGDGVWYTFLEIPCIDEIIEKARELCKRHDLNPKDEPVGFEIKLELCLSTISKP